MVLFDVLLDEMENCGVVDRKIKCIYVPKCADGWTGGVITYKHGPKRGVEVGAGQLAHLRGSSSK